MFCIFLFQFSEIPRDFVFSISGFFKKCAPNFPIQFFFSSKFAAEISQICGANFKAKVFGSRFRAPPIRGAARFNLAANRPHCAESAAYIRFRFQKHARTIAAMIRCVVRRKNARCRIYAGCGTWRSIPHRVASRLRRDSNRAALRYMRA